jgi:hypothetical protein
MGKWVRQSHRISLSVTNQPEALTVPIDPSTLEELQAEGIQFIVEMRVPNGVERVILTVSDVLAYVENPEDFYCRKNNIDKAKYREWLLSDGTPRCGFIKKDGQRCANFVGGGSQMTFERWSELDGTECHVHRRQE